MAFQGLTSAANNISLNMECFEDELSPVQMLAYETMDKQFRESHNILDTLVNNGNVMFKNNHTSVICVNNNLPLQFLKLTPKDELQMVGDKGNLAVPTDELCNSFQMTQFKDNLSKNYVDFTASTTDAMMKSIQTPTTNQPTPFLTSNDNNPTFDHSYEIAPTDDNRQGILVNDKTEPNPFLEVKPSTILTSIQQKTITEEQLRLCENMALLKPYHTAKFTEWLLKQGLIHTEQRCSVHGALKNNRLKMKHKGNITECEFPFSGGYVLVSDCCPNRFISIFKGSLFDGAPYPPATVILLLYHWSCQNDPLNIIESEGVNKSYLRTFFTNLRGVCTAAIHEDCKGLLGGKHTMVEVGIIGLEFKSGNKKHLQSKMLILGVLESNSKRIRMIVIKREEKGGKFKYTENKKLLLPLLKLVKKNSMILTDLSLERKQFTNLGFNKIYQRPILDQKNKKVYSNGNIMKYLKNFLLPMLRRSSSALNHIFLQQCLNELCWREKWGVTSLRAFNSIIGQIRQQGKVSTGVTLQCQLSKIVHNPFMNWQYSSWKTNFWSLNMKANTLVYADKVIQDSTNMNKTIETDTNENFTTTCNLKNKTNEQEIQKLYPGNHRKVVCELTPLEPYYYGTLPGDRNVLEIEKKVTLNMKCILCDTVRKTNIDMMKHVIEHSLYNYQSFHKDEWCEYCLKLQTNHQNIHKPFNGLLKCAGEHFKSTKPTFRCLICEQDFKFRTTLIIHMNFSHDEMELPYECDVCKFRASQHHIVVDHFYEVHDNGEKVQCPLCLKVISFTDKGFLIPKNVYFFLNHLKTHSYNKLVKKCNKCVLSFLNEELLHYHQINHHKSCKDIPNIKRYKSCEVMMPMPVNDHTIKNNAQTSGLQEKQSHNGTNYIENIHKTSRVYCKNKEIHETYSNGKFSSSVNNRMFYSNRSTSDTSIKNHTCSVNINRIILDKVMQCFCGFISNSGNELANHLVNCDKTTVHNL